MTYPIYAYTYLYFFCVTLNKRGIVAMIILLATTLTAQTMSNTLVFMRQQPGTQEVVKIILCFGVILGPTANFFFAIVASETAFYAHKAAVTDPIEL